MIKQFYFFFICFINIHFCYSQKKVSVNFIVGNDTIKNVDYYYYLTENNRKKIFKKEKNKIILSKELMDQEEVKVFAITRRRKLEFYIKPKEMYYLTIMKDRGLFNKKYIINQGFDYEEIVKCSNNTN